MPDDYPMDEPPWGEAPHPDSQKASESAMRAAKRILHMEKSIEWTQGRLVDADELISTCATIIDEERDDGWVKCLDRMPTEADSDDYGDIHWLRPTGESMIYSWNDLDDWEDEFKPTHWRPISISSEEKKKDE